MKRDFDERLNRVSPKEVKEILLGIPKEMVDVIREKTKAKRKYRKAERNFTAVAGKLAESARWNEKIRYTTKIEIESHICQNAEWQKAKSEMDDAEAELDFWEDRMTFIKQTGYSLRNYIEFEKFLAGDV